jgi:ribonucleoside-diphosphate reductase alpha chain
MADVDPLKIQIDKRPDGELPAVCEKITYWTSEGKKQLYLVVSFINVDGVVNGKKVSIERPIEFFLPIGQKDEGHQWVVSTMRMLSLAARGGYTAKALDDMTQVSWDRGPVRCGFIQKADGTKAARFHASETAAVAYAIQQILFRRGFLDIEGNQVPSRVLSKAATESVEEAAEAHESRAHASKVIPGKPCKECGAHAVIKRDGCEYCSNCGAIGSCG